MSFSSRTTSSSTPDNGNEDPIEHLNRTIRTLTCISKTNTNRWNEINLGLFQVIITKLLKNGSQKTSIILAVIGNIIFSLIDTSSDLVIAYTLYSNNEWEYALIVVIIDYLPGWQLLIHNISSPRWKKLKNKKQKMITIIFLLFSPCCLPLFFIHWLSVFDAADKHTFEYLHHNARLSHLLSGSLESPLQVMMLFTLYGEGKLHLPWAKGQIYALITDPQGNPLDLGMFPGLFSLVISVVVIFKGALEMAETTSREENLFVCGYAICNFVFRITSFSLAILYFKQWSSILFVLVLVINVVIIIRYDVSKREGYSIATSALISIFTPFISSDQPHRFQVISADNKDDKSKRNLTQRRCMSAQMAKTTFLPILFSDLILYCLLKYYPGFKYSEDIILETETAQNLLLMLIFPISISTLLATKSFPINKDKKGNAVSDVSRDYFNPSEIVEMFNEKLRKRTKSFLRYFGLCSSVILLNVALLTTPFIIPQKALITKSLENGKLYFKFA